MYREESEEVQRSIATITRNLSREGCLEPIMDREWNDNQPIYRQLRDRVVAMILDGVLKEGDPLPSVRNVAAEYRVNHLTVLKGYQQLVDEQLVEIRNHSAARTEGGRTARCGRKPPVVAGCRTVENRRGGALKPWHA